MADVQLQAVITAKDEASEKVRGVEMSLGKMTAAVALGQAAFAAFNKVVDAGVGFLKTSVKEFGVQEQATARLRQGMKNVETAFSKTAEGAKILEENNGDLAGQIDTVTENLVAQAAALQKTTTFGDEQIISAQAMLSTFMLNQHQIEALTPSILDMAAALQKTTGEQADLQQISILLGKALGGEDVAGLAGALRRVGVVMTEHQTKVLETGKMEERLNTLTTIVAQNFGGFAAAQAQTFTGKMEQMKNAVSDVRETIGGYLAPILANLATQLKDFVTSEKFNNFLLQIKNGLETAGKWAIMLRDHLSLIFTENIRATFLNLNETLNAIGISSGLAGQGFNIIEVALSPLVGLAQVFLTTLNGILAGLRALAAAKDKTQGILGGFVDFTQNPFGLISGKASGGYVASNTPYMVGEQGPELFVPKQSGTIIPNNKMGGGVTINISGNTIRSDDDLDRIISEIKRALNRDQVVAGLGV